MKTKANLERLASSVGATLEEDTGLRDMRVFQIVAPDGMAWRDSGSCHLRIDWATGSTKHAIAFNEDAFRDAAGRVKCGMMPDPEHEHS